MGGQPGDIEPAAESAAGEELAAINAPATHTPTGDGPVADSVPAADAAGTGAVEGSVEAAPPNTPSVFVNGGAVGLGLLLNAYPSQELVSVPQPRVYANLGRLPIKCCHCTLDSVLSVFL